MCFFIAVLVKEMLNYTSDLGLLLLQRICIKNLLHCLLQLHAQGRLWLIECSVLLREYEMHHSFANFEKNMKHQDSEDLNPFFTLEENNACTVSILQLK